MTMVRYAGQAGEDLSCYGDCTHPNARQHAKLGRGLKRVFDQNGGHKECATWNVFCLL